MKKKMSKEALSALPKVRLRYGPGKDDYFECRYMHANKEVDLPLALRYFKPNGMGLPMACGTSNSALENRDRFPHPVFLAYSIESAIYIVVQVDDEGKPELAVRYRHRGGPIISAYDKSHDNPAIYRPLLEALIQEHPVLRLLKGRMDPRPAGHAHGPGGGNGPTKLRGLTGHARRMHNAKFIDKATLDRVTAQVKGMAAA